MRRIAIALASLLLTVPAAGGADAAPPQKAGSRAMPWRSATSITWSGSKGVRLSSPTALRLLRKTGSYEEPYRITVLRGTWAFVRIIAPTGSDCTFATRPGNHCAIWMVSAAKELSHWSDGSVDWTGKNPLAAGTTEVYLFTDGAARLDLRATGARPGTARYEATGKVTGTVRRLPDQCIGTCGSEDFGGEARSLKNGSADVLVANRFGDNDPLCAQGARCRPGALAITACALSGPAVPPHGCYHTGPIRTWTEETTFDIAALDVHPDCTGSCYLGWRKTGPGTPTAWGTWFEYGIS